MKNKNKKVKLLVSVFFFFILFSFSEKVSASEQYYGEITGTGAGTELSPTTFPATSLYRCGSYPSQDRYTCTGNWTLESSMPSNFGIGGASVDGTYYFLLSSQNDGSNTYDPDNDIGYYVWTVSNCSTACVWTTDEISAQATSTRITSIISPVNNTTLPTTLATFSFRFWNGEPVYDRYGFELRDITGNFQYISKESSILASGFSTVSTTTSVTANHFHMWRAYLKDTSTGSYIYSNWNSFEVVGSSASSSPLLSGNDYATSTNGFLEFLNVPELLKTKAPFAYLPLMWNTLTQTSGIATSTVATSTMSFVMASSTSFQQTITIDFFSETVFRRFLSQDLINLLRGLLATLIYAGTLWYIYHDLINRKVT